MEKSTIKMQLIIIVFLTIVLRCDSIDRIACVQEKSCKLCSNLKYSDYRCIGHNDCYSSEYCTEGFCCPGTRESVYGRCPDGSVTASAIFCTADFHCSKDASKVCSNNVCCPKRTIVETGRCPPSNKVSNVFNQCTSDVQCQKYHKCCSTAFGVRCTAVVADLACYGANEVTTGCFEPCQPHCGYLNRRSCRVGGCQGGCHCAPGYVRLNQQANSPCVLPSSVGCVGTTHLCRESNQIQVQCYEPCQPYCGNLNRLPCRSGVCRKGCSCPSGYVRQTSDPNAPCVLITLCNCRLVYTTAEISATLQGGVAEMRRIGSSIYGTVRLAAGGSSSTRVTGKVSGVPSGVHQLTINSIGDLSSACGNTGAMMYVVGNYQSGGNVVSIDSEIAMSDGVRSAYGRSLVLYRDQNWALPLACAVIGRG